MRTAPHNPSTSGNSRAFTKVELLVIIIVVSLLAVLHLTAATGARNQSKLAQCSGNLRQLGQCMLLYSADSSNLLPTVTAGNWPCDISYLVCDLMMRRGATRDTFYDPGFPEQNTDANWQYAPGQYRRTGYAYTFYGTAKLPHSECNLTTTALRPVRGIYTDAPLNASQRVLIADSTISDNPDRSAHFTGIPATINSMARSPHLDGFTPLGGNLVMLDGHVEWRSFDQMSVRSTGTMPYFWW